MTLPVFFTLIWRFRYSLKQKEQQNKAALISKKGGEEHAGALVLGVEENFMQSHVCFFIVFGYKKRIALPVLLYVG